MGQASALRDPHNAMAMVRKAELVSPPPLLAQSVLERRELCSRSIPGLGHRRTQRPRPKRVLEADASFAQPLTQERGVENGMQHVVRRSVRVEEGRDQWSSRRIMGEEEVSIVLPR